MGRASKKSKQSRRPKNWGQNFHTNNTSNGEDQTVEDPQKVTQNDAVEEESLDEGPVDVGHSHDPLDDINPEQPTEAQLAEMRARSKEIVDIDYFMPEVLKIMLNHLPYCQGDIEAVSEKSYGGILKCFALKCDKCNMETTLWTAPPPPHILWQSVLRPLHQ